MQGSASCSSANGSNQGQTAPCLVFESTSVTKEDTLVCQSLVILDESRTSGKTLRQSYGSFIEEIVRLDILFRSSCHPALARFVYRQVLHLGVKDKVLTTCSSGQTP